METFLVSIGSHTQLAFSCWVRGIELEVRGYVEKADRRVGILQDSLVIEEMRPVDPGARARWREPDIDDLLDTGEYLAIEQAFFETHERFNESDWPVFDSFWYERDETELIHEEWRAYWMPGARTYTLDEPLDAYRDLPPIVDNE